MKKYFGLLFCLFALNACDDGDMVFESFNFDSVDSGDCGVTSTINTVFKINKNEALILKLDGPQTFFTSDGQEYTATVFPFRNQVTPVGTSKIYKISTLNKVIYRVFTGDVPSTYFCQDIPPISPSVVSESSTQDNGNGIIEIRTAIIENDYPSISQVEYRHSIVLKNITFSDANGTTTYENFPYGSYDKKSNVSFSFPTTSTIQKCADGRLFRISDRNLGNDPKKENLNEVLEFKISDAELAALEIGDNPPLKIDDAHQLTYRIFNNDVNANFLCTGDATGLTPFPEVYATYKAINGTDGDGGAVQSTGVITIRKIAVPTPVGGFSYTINFSRLTFKDVESATTFKQESYNFVYTTN